MSSNRKHKHTLYARLARLPLDLIAVSDKMEQSTRCFEKELGLPLRSHSLYYILKGHRPQAAPYWRYIMWMRSRYPEQHRVTFTIASSRAGRWTVSTIFLGLDHGMPHSGAPVLFETMAFERRPDGTGAFRDEQYRYHTWERAIRGHRQLAARLSRLRVVA